MRTLLPLLACLALAACTNESPAPGPPARFRETFHQNEYESGFGYSQAVKVGHTVYVSGTVAVDEKGQLMNPGDMAGQLRTVYGNLALTLKTFGATFDNVVMERIYTTDMPELLKVADLRTDFYSKNVLPAVTWVEVRQLVDPGFLVQIDAVVELP